MPRDYEKKQKQSALGLNSSCASQRQIENFQAIHCNAGPVWTLLTIFYNTTLKHQFIPDTSPQDSIWIYLGLCVFICLGFVIVLFHTLWRLSLMQLWLASSLLCSWGEPWSLDHSCLCLLSAGLQTRTPIPSLYSAGDGLEPTTLWQLGKQALFPLSYTFPQLPHYF